MTEERKTKGTPIVHMWECSRPDSTKPAAGYPILKNAKHVKVCHATQASGGYNHHAQFVYHAGRFHAMWSNHPHGEDGPGQRVLYASSEDATHWQSFVELLPAPQKVRHGEDNGLVLTAHKWVKSNGRLFAIVGLHRNEGFCDPNGNGHSKMRTEKHSRRRRVGYSVLARAVRPDGERSPVFALRPNLPDDIQFAITPPGHGPSVNGVKDLSERYGSSDCTPAWDFEGVLGFPKARDGHPLCEPTVYRAQTGKVVMLMRDTAYSHRMFVTVSPDGRSWPSAQPSDIPDSPSLSDTVVLNDGTVLLIGNHMAPKFDNAKEQSHYNRDPLMVSVSPDGHLFTRAYALRTGVQNFRVPDVGGRGGGAQYPSALIHNRHLYVLYSMGKEDIWVSSVPLSDLEVTRPE